jgi:hypothetical protein
MERGGWHIVNVDREQVFVADSAAYWQGLVKQQPKAGD